MPAAKVKSGPEKSEARDDAAVRRAIAIRKAAPWMPSEGEMRTSTLIGMRKQADDFNGHIVLILEDDVNGIYAYHVFSTLEYAQLSELKPAKGALLTIYNGGKRETNESKRAYRAYSDQVDALRAAGRNDEADKVTAPERRLYHDNLILAGDGSDVSEMEEFDWNNQTPES